MPTSVSPVRDRARPGAAPLRVYWFTLRCSARQIGEGRLLAHQLHQRREHGVGGAGGVRVRHLHLAAEFRLDQVGPAARRRRCGGDQLRLLKPIAERAGIDADGAEPASGAPGAPPSRAARASAGERYSAVSFSSRGLHVRVARAAPPDVAARVGGLGADLRSASRRRTGASSARGCRWRARRPPSSGGTIPPAPSNRPSVARARRRTGQQRGQRAGEEGAEQATRCTHGLVPPWFSRSVKACRRAPGEPPAARQPRPERGGGEADRIAAASQSPLSKSLVQQPASRAMASRAAVPGIDVQLDIAVEPPDRRLHQAERAGAGAPHAGAGGHDAADQRDEGLGGRRSDQPVSMMARPKCGRGGGADRRAVQRRAAAARAAIDLRRRMARNGPDAGAPPSAPCRSRRTSGRRRGRSWTCRRSDRGSRAARPSGPRRRLPRRGSARRGRPSRADRG